jgi:hypothetical protein
MVGYVTSLYSPTRERILTIQKLIAATTADVFPERNHEFWDVRKRLTNYSGVARNISDRESSC